LAIAGNPGEARRRNISVEHDAGFRMKRDAGSSEKATQAPINQSKQTEALIRESKPHRKNHWKKTKEEKQTWQSKS